MSDPAPSLAVIVDAIQHIRGHRVMVDADLAGLYGVPTKALNQAVKRNLRRFPADFMFQLTADEAASWQASRSRSVTLKRGGNLKYLPRAFTEQGVAMLASVLGSDRAIEASIAIMRAFVAMRRAIAANAEIAGQLARQESRLDQHDEAFAALQQLMDDTAADADRPAVGFALPRR